VVQAQDLRCSRGLKEAVRAAMAAWPQTATARTPGKAGTVVKRLKKVSR